MSATLYCKSTCDTCRGALKHVRAPGPHVVMGRDEAAWEALPG